MADFSSKDPKEWTVSTSEAAEIFGCTPRWIQQRAKDGYFTPVARGQYRFTDIRAGFERQIQEAEERAAGSEVQQRLWAARAREVEARVERLDAMSIDRAEALDILDTMIEIYLAFLDEMPTTMAAELGVDVDKAAWIIGPSRDRLAQRFAKERAKLSDDQPESHLPVED